MHKFRKCNKYCGSPEWNVVRAVDRLCDGNGNNSIHTGDAKKNTDYPIIAIS